MTCHRVALLHLTINPSLNTIQSPIRLCIGEMIRPSVPWLAKLDWYYTIPICCSSHVLGVGVRYVKLKRLNHVCFPLSVRPRIHHRCDISHVMLVRHHSDSGHQGRAMQEEKGPTEKSLFWITLSEAYP
jgi:hypothetical protein